MTKKNVNIIGRPPFFLSHLPSQDSIITSFCFGKENEEKIDRLVLRVRILPTWRITHSYFQLAYDRVVSVFFSRCLRTVCGYSKGRRAVSDEGFEFLHEKKGFAGDDNKALSLRRGGIASRFDVLMKN